MKQNEPPFCRFVGAKDAAIHACFAESRRQNGPIMSPKSGTLPAQQNATVGRQTTCAPRVRRPQNKMRKTPSARGYCLLLSARCPTKRRLALRPPPSALSFRGPQQPARCTRFGERARRPGSRSRRASGGAIFAPCPTLDGRARPSSHRQRMWSNRAGRVRNWREPTTLEIRDGGRGAATRTRGRAPRARAMLVRAPRID